MARMTIMGAGVVGTAMGTGMTSLGHAVTLVDENPLRVEQLVAFADEVGVPLPMLRAVLTVNDSMKVAALQVGSGAVGGERP